MESNHSEGHSEISRLLRKYNQESVPEQTTFQNDTKGADSAAPARQEQYNQSFEKLEEKVLELEEKFAASAAQNQAVMQELSLTRRFLENQQSNDSVLANITATIAQLKESVDNLSRSRQTQSGHEGAYRPIVAEAPVFGAHTEQTEKPSYQVEHDSPTIEQAKLRMSEAEVEKIKAALEVEHAEKIDLIFSFEQERRTQAKMFSAVQEDNTTKARFISHLQKKASQLKAVNSALDREIKRAQQDRIEALRKSAEQAKEILSLRDALTAEEERFKSFDFEGRIISIRREFEQKVHILENQLHEISATCIRQVEEIESLKGENLKLHKLAEEREQLAALYDVKIQELQTLQTEMEQLRREVENPTRLAALTQRMQRLQQEHTILSERLTQTQQILQTVTTEKENVKKQFKALLCKINENDAVISNLKERIEVLTRENEALRRKHAPAASTKPAPPAPARTPVPVRQPKAPAKNVLHAQAEEPLPSNTPVEVPNTLRAAVQTEADLPDIQVAEPVQEPQIEEDFLEKTDSFIGRMKWSIFRDDN